MYVKCLQMTLLMMDAAAGFGDANTPNFGRPKRRAQFRGGKNQGMIFTFKLTDSSLRSCMKWTLMFQKIRDDRASEQSLALDLPHTVNQVRLLPFPI
jgi:hypothetical protein